VHFGMYLPMHLGMWFIRSNDIKIIHLVRSTIRNNITNENLKNAVGVAT
jgi:hypothetical protein